MKQIFKENLFFFIPYFLFLVISTIILLLYTKADIHIIINKNSNIYFDTFFKNFTYLGDGLLIVFFILSLLFIKYRHFFTALITTLTTLGIIQFLKYQFVTPRPAKYFNEIYTGDYKLYLIENLDIHVKYSFPSGHTTTAFTIFMILALITNPKYKILKFIYFVAALLVGYSRMYLSQHFLIDVVAGSIIGVSISLLVYYLMSKKKNKKIENSLIKLITKS